MIKNGATWELTNVILAMNVINIVIKLIYIYYKFKLMGNAPHFN